MLIEGESIFMNMSKKMNSGFVHGESYKYGIMMENENAVSIAVRKETDNIADRVKLHSSAFNKNKFFKIPIIRGLTRFVEGSTNQFRGERDVAKLYNTKSIKDQRNSERIIPYLSFVGILIVGFISYFFIPTVITFLLKSSLKNLVILNFFEGILRIIIFLLIFVTFSKTKNAKLSALYHGAEHKVLFCHLKGEKITIENAKKYSIYNPSCGSSLFIILIIFSIPAFIWLNYENLFLRTGTMLLLLPLLIGFSFDLVMWAAYSKSKFAKIITAPGVFLQRFNTKEPDDKHLEVAVLSLKNLLSFKS